LAEGAVRILDVVVLAEPQDRKGALPPDLTGLRSLRRVAEFGEQVPGRHGGRQIECCFLANQQRLRVTLGLGELVEVVGVPVAQRLVAALVVLYNPLSMPLPADEPAALLLARLDVGVKRLAQTLLAEPAEPTPPCTQPRDPVVLPARCDMSAPSRRRLAA